MFKDDRELWPVKMRVKLVGELGKELPLTARFLFNQLYDHCRLKGLKTLTFQVNRLPTSANAMYRKRRGDFGPKGKQFYLSPDAEEFRALTIEALGERRWSWKPTGVTAAIALYESPYWISKTHRVRENDVDNRAKCTFDAVKIATNVPDELHWELHLYKLLSKRTRTTVFLFDMGEVLEYFY